MTSSISYNKEIGAEWTKITEVADGNTWHIEPLNKDIKYIISEEAPTIEGGIIERHDQLTFSKVTGDLYLKDIDGLGKTDVYINMQEEAASSNEPADSEETPGE